MRMTVAIAVSALMAALSCGNMRQNSGSSPDGHASTPDGQINSRKNARYINENQFRSALSNKNETIIIFGAGMCTACRLIRVAIQHAKVDAQVLSADLREPWALELTNASGIVGAPSVPSVLHVSKGGKALVIRVGSNNIMSYLTNLQTR